MDPPHTWLGSRTLLLMTYTGLTIGLLNACKSAGQDDPTTVQCLFVALALAVMTEICVMPT